MLSTLSRPKWINISPDAVDALQAKMDHDQDEFEQLFTNLNEQVAGYASKKGEMAIQLVRAINI